MANINEKFIVNLKGKDFVTYEGLLDLAHQGELQEIKTELIQLPAKENGNQCIVKAVVIGPNKHFEGYGDADPTNVNSMITRHIIRMAETRAKARALRDYTNVGMTAVEELGDVEEDKPSNRSSNSKKTDKMQASKPVDKEKQAIVDNSLATDKQLNFIYKLAKDRNYSSEEMKNYIKSAYQKDSSKALTKKEASEMIEMLNELGKEELPDILK
jgi:hypothetical protein